MTNRLVTKPLSPPPGLGFLPLLRDSDWTTATGQRLSIAGMNNSHLWNVLGYLRWYADYLATIVPEAEGEAPEAVLSSQPIWHAISAELVRRGELHDKEAAWDHLRAGGEVPWERADRRRVTAAAARAKRKSLGRP